MMKKQETGNEIKKKLDEKTNQSIETKMVLLGTSERDETHREAH